MSKLQTRVLFNIEQDDSFIVLLKFTLINKVAKKKKTNW